MLGKVDSLDAAGLLVGSVLPETSNTDFISFPFQQWASMRQMEFEGGFQGRTNKLVDGCYSTWQGGVFPLLRSSATLAKLDPTSTTWDFDRSALKEYILTAGQSPKGGLRDKPGK